MDLFGVDEDTTEFRGKIRSKLEKLYELQLQHLVEQHAQQLKLLKKTKKITAAGKQKTKISTKPSKKALKWEQLNDEWNVEVDNKIKQAVRKSSKLSADSSIAELLTFPLQLQRLQSAREQAENVSSDGVEPHPREYQTTSIDLS